MSTWAYTITHNEAFILPYWLRHYSTFCDKLIVYDDQSDDGTVELAQQAGAEVRECPWHGLNDIAAMQLARVQYKEGLGEADWVVWVDADEILYHPRMTWYLDQLRLQGITLPCVEGYSMFTDSLPNGKGQLYDEITAGLPDDRYSKPVILNPFQDMWWGPGRHEWQAPGATRDEFSTSKLKLLHFRWFGEEDYLRRNSKNISRLSASNIESRLGIEVFDPNYNGHHSLRWYRESSEQATQCI